MQVTLTFDTDQLTLANVYQMLVGAKQAAPPTEADASSPRPVEGVTALVDTAKANRQAAAAKARAAKGTSAAAVPKTPVTDVLGPDDTNPVTNGQDQDQDQDDMGLSPPSLSPGETKDQALALVREVYAAGHVAEVKKLQKEWDVAKFYDVPVEQAHVFMQAVMKLAVGVGLRK